MRDKLIRENRADRDVMICSEYGEALTLLKCMNRDQHRNEIYAVYSEQLSRKKGHFETPLEIAWLGVDVFCGGYGSLLLQGLFQRPSAFPAYISQINSNGLFAIGSAAIHEYIEDYARAASDYELEPIESVLEYIDQIAIGRVGAAP